MDRRYTSLGIEVLEDRRLLSVNAAAVQSAFGSVLQSAQNDLATQLGNAVPIPLIGSQLTNFIQQQGLSHLNQSSALKDLLNSSLLTSIAPYTNIVNNSDQPLQFDLHADDTEHFSFDLGLGGKLLTVQSTPDADDVVTVNVALAFDYLVSFTCHGDNSVTINAPNGTLKQVKSALPQNTMAVSLTVTLPNFSAAGSLNGFLFVHAADHAANHTLFTASFGANPDPTSGVFSGVTLQGRATLTSIWTCPCRPK